MTCEAGVPDKRAIVGPYKGAMHSVRSVSALAL